MKRIYKVLRRVCHISFFCYCSCFYRAVGLNSGTTVPSPVTCPGLPMRRSEDRTRWYRFLRQDTRSRQRNRPSRDSSARLQRHTCRTTDVPDTKRMSGSTRTVTEFNPMNIRRIIPKSSVRSKTMKVGQIDNSIETFF